MFSDASIFPTNVPQKLLLFDSNEANVSEISNGRLIVAVSDIVFSDLTVGLRQKVCQLSGSSVVAEGSDNIIHLISSTIRDKRPHYSICKACALILQRYPRRRWINRSR